MTRRKESLGRLCLHSDGARQRPCVLGFLAGRAATEPAQDLAELIVRRKGETMKHLDGIALGFSLLIGTVAVGTSLAAGEPKAALQQSQSNPSSKPAQISAPNRGQQVFERNCSRCHNAPQGFSSNISGTIAMHMRVRAGLSEDDYKALLRFLNH